VAVIQCIENPPHFIALQWDGTNQQEVHDFVFHLDPNMEQYLQSETVDGDGTLIIYVQYVGVPPIPLNGWVVFGPFWPVRQPDARMYPPNAYTDEQFECANMMHLNLFAGAAEFASVGQEPLHEF
jgi:hypothetical protein